MHKRVGDVKAMKGAKKIVAITAYDYTMASLCERGGADVLLVGDSAGMVMLGYPSTIPVTMEHMCMFTGAVARARKSSLVVADLPFMSYQTGAERALENSGRLIREGADAVKLEGGREVAETVRAITDAGIPVMGHIGLQPQSAELYQGYEVRGRTDGEAQALLEEARLLEEAGAFCVVLEKVAHQAARMVTGGLGIPTIGIGSGAACDGQVLVVHDMLGMYEKELRFVKRYATLSEDIRQAVSEYRRDVEEGSFPGREQTFYMGEGNQA